MTASSTAPREAHTLRAGDDGLDVLAFGTRVPTRGRRTSRGRGVGWIGGTWVDAGARRSSRGSARPRPENRSCRRSARGPERRQRRRGRRRRARRTASWRWLARQRGAELTGLNWAAHRRAGGRAAALPLRRRGDLRRARRRGRLELWPTPQRARERRRARGSADPRRPRRSRGRRRRGIAHGFRAGAAGLTYLAYGTRNANDVCYYPRSNKIYFRGLGLIARLEDLDYDDGEPQ